MKELWQFLCDQDWLLVFIPMVIVTILFFCFGLFFWGIMFTIIMTTFGITEFWAILTTGRTISQQFTAFMREHKILGWIVIWAMAAFWFALLVHLLSTS